MKLVKWGIIGCGDVTEVKSGPPLQIIENSELVAVMRRDIIKAKDYAFRHQVPKFYDNALRLIQDQKVNAIYVATPPSSHKKYTIQALKAGKAVYVEKPMAVNYAECQEMVKVAKSTKVPLFVAYYRRALPSFLKVKGLVESGIIGKIRLINLQLFKSITPKMMYHNQNLAWRFKPEISGGGLLYDLGSHQLDYLHYLFGKIKKINALVANQKHSFKTEDIASACLIFKSGIMCNCSWCFSLPEEFNRDIFEIIGDRGKIKFSTFKFTPIKVYTKTGLKKYEYQKPRHVQQYLLKTVVGELLGIKKCPSTMESAAYTSLILDQINQQIHYLNQ